MKKQENTSRFEEHIKQELNNYRAPYDPNSWNLLKNKLPKYSYKKWYLASAIIISILGLTVYLLNNNTYQKQTATKQLAVINKKSQTKLFTKKTKSKTTPFPSKENKPSTSPTPKKHHPKTINKKIISPKEIKKTTKTDSVKNPIIETKIIKKENPIIKEETNTLDTNWEIANINIQYQSLCSPASIYFSVQNLPKNTHVQWNFGDNNSSTAINSNHTYKTDGEYKVSLKIFNNKKEKTLHKSISIKKSPIASFYYNDKEDNITLENTSTNFSDAKWIINHKTISEDSLLSSFLNTGEYTIQLIVKNKNNCLDSCKKTVNFKLNYNIYAPTAFSPDNDGINDEYMIKYKILENHTYNFQIFNNLGVLIFESSKPTASWNGMIGNNMAPKGKYLWKLNITDSKNKIEQFNGYFKLIR